MRHLFVARHGEYNQDKERRLSDKGKEQMKSLGEAIQKILQGQSAYLVSSNEVRAVESSEVLATILGLPPEFEQVHGLRSSHPASLKYMETFLQGRQEDAVIVVGHEAFAEDFPDHYLRTHLDAEPLYPSVGNGQAVHIDLETKTAQVLP